MRARLRLDERDLLRHELTLEVTMTVAEWLRLADALAGKEPGLGIFARFYLTLSGALRGFRSAVNREYVYMPAGRVVRGRGPDHG